MNVVYSGRSARNDPEQEREPAPDEQKDALAEAVARLKNQGLTAPAIIALEVLKPLGFVGSQLLLILDPLLSPLTGEGTQRWADILEDRAHVERLLNLLKDESPACCDREL